MKKISLLLLYSLLLFSFEKMWGQSFSLPAKQVAMANTKATTYGAASYGNPASAAFSVGFSGFASIENRFYGTDIQGVVAGISYTSDKYGSLQIGVNRVGIQGLYFQEMTLGYAKRLGARAAIGGNILLLNRQADHYDNYQTISFNIGTQFPLSENIQAGIYLSNPIPDRQELPLYNFNSEFAAGITWKITKLTTVFEIVKPQHTKYTIKTAIDYQPMKAISILGGIIVSDKDLLPSLGLSYRLKSVELTMSSTFHPQLSTGLNFGVSYSSQSTSFSE